MNVAQHVSLMFDVLCEESDMRAFKALLGREGKEREGEGGFVLKPMRSTRFPSSLEVLKRERKLHYSYGHTEIPILDNSRQFFFH